MRDTWRYNLGMPMNPRPDNTWMRAEGLYEAALLQPEERREAFVEASGADEATRGEVLKLLRAQQRMGDFLQAPILDFQGQTFGRYRAVAELGRGGMSVVYRGERVDGGFEKQVAIKVLLLQATADLSSGETQILALLEHPNVTRLLDAGVTAMGFRYLVMELVEGQPCTAYAQRLGERDRLRLFLQVCAGVQAAHRALIIHRDLKPDNILVTPDGTVKLLDFGIAKVLAEHSGPQTTGVRAFTADYASPEQILSLPATTAADIYSLGVLLCELIGGKVPRSFADLSFPEVLRQVQTEEVNAVPLEGDLAVIAKKAMRRDPLERYASVDALARDVENYLAGWPIEARAPSWGYRAGKFIRRHRVGVSVAALVAAALGITTGIAVRQAQLAGKRFEQVRSLSRTVMFELHDAVQNLPGSLKARQLIVENSLKYLDALASDSDASDAVQVDVAAGYLRLAEIHGKDYGGNNKLDAKEGLRLSQKGLAMARRIAARQPNDVAVQRVLVDALDYTASAYSLQGRDKEALPLGEEAVREAERLYAAGADRAARERLALVTKQLGTLYFETGRSPEAIALYRRSLQMRQQLFDEFRTPGPQQRLSEAHNWLANALIITKDLDGAEPHVRESLRLDRLRYATYPALAAPNIAGALGQLGIIAMRRKQWDQAIVHYAEQVAIRREMLIRDPDSATVRYRLSSALNRLSGAYREARKFPQAIQTGQEALAQARLIPDGKSRPVRDNLIYALVDLGDAHTMAGQFRKACPYAREADAQLRALPQGLAGQRRQVAEMLTRCPAAP